MRDYYAVFYYFNCTGRDKEQYGFLHVVYVLVSYLLHATGLQLAVEETVDVAGTSIGR